MMVIVHSKYNIFIVGGGVECVDFAPNGRRAILINHGECSMKGKRCEANVL